MSRNLHNAALNLYCMFFLFLWNMLSLISLPRVLYSLYSNWCCWWCLCWHLVVCAVFLSCVSMQCMQSKILFYHS